MKSNFRFCHRLPLSVSTLAFAVIAPLFSATASASGNNSQPVTAYKHVNFRGRTLSVGEGDVSIRTIRRSVGNDRISSFRIAAGYEVYACAHNRFRGTCKTFTSDTNDLRTINFNDVISSFRVTKVPKLPVTVFQHVNFRGNSLNVGAGKVTIQDLRSSSVGNDRISSIRVADGYEVVACQHGRHNGRCETFTSDIADLRKIHFNDAISSLKVQLVSTATNTAPIANSLDISTAADTPIDFTVLFSDVDGDPLTISSTSPSDGLLTDNGNGTFNFDPAGDFSTLLVGQTRTVTFNYTVSDGTDQATATVSIEVTGTTPPFVNIPPVADDFSVDTDADTSIEIDVRSFVRDDNGDALFFPSATGLTPLIGVLTDNGNGTFNFDPAGMFSTLLVGQTETVRFDYTVSDGIANATATVSIDVEGTLEPTITYAIGETGPGGGTVFQLDNPINGRSTSGLEYAPAISDELLTWIDAIDFADGFSTPTASDWFLPSADQLLILQADGVLFDTNGAALGGNSWWSSTEDTPQNAFVVNVFIGSEPATEDRTNQHNALPVRSF